MQYLISREIMNCSKFKMVKYHNQEYQKDISLSIEEVSAHFDVEPVEGRM